MADRRTATAKQTWYCVHLQLKSIVESSRILINEVFFRNLYMAAARFGIMLNCELWKAEMMLNLHLYATLSQLWMFWFIDHLGKRNLFCKARLQYYRTFNYTCTWNFFIEFPTNYQYNLCTKIGHEKKSYDRGENLQGTIGSSLAVQWWNIFLQGTQDGCIKLQRSLINTWIFWR